MGGKGGRDSFDVALLRDIESRVMFEGVLWPDGLPQHPATGTSLERITRP